VWFPNRSHLVISWLAIRTDGASIAVGGADTELAKALEPGLDEINMAATDVDEERTFSVGIDEPDGTLIGGLTGWIWGYTSGISMVWIRTSSRGDGWGARLLASAEQEVRRQGCRRIFVSSFNFQAPDFYRRHGYEEIARVPGLLADGVEDVWFVKHLHVADGC